MHFSRVQSKILLFVAITETVFSLTLCAKLCMQSVLQNKKPPALQRKTSVNYCLPAYSPAGLCTCKPKQLAQTSFFLGTIYVLSQIWFALISPQPSEIQTLLFMHCQKQMFLLVHNGGTFLWRNKNVSKESHLSRGQEELSYWSMLLVLIYFVCLKIIFNHCG